MKISCVIFVFYISNKFNGVQCLNFHTGKQGSKQATFERFDNTCGGPNVPITFNYTDMKYDGSKLVMNCTITSKENILTDPKMLLDINRCKTRENLDTCEPFYVYKVDKYCPTLESYMSVWASFFSGFEPPWKCPIKKVSNGKRHFSNTTYRATNTTIDSSAFLRFPVNNWYWKLKINLRDPNTDRMLMCLIIEAHIK